MPYVSTPRLVYRDIKPENIGFDMRGDVKVFDFGLCKNLSPQLKAKGGYGYRLTGRAGSLPYMVRGSNGFRSWCRLLDPLLCLYSFPTGT